jgi:hypothetical protein
MIEGKTRVKNQDKLSLWSDLISVLEFTVTVSCAAERNWRDLPLLLDLDATTESGLGIITRGDRPPVVATTKSVPKSAPTPNTT